MFQRKLTSFRARMQSTVDMSYTSLIDDPMGTGLKIPGGDPTVSKIKLRLVRDSKVAENYKEGGAGFIPDTFKWILTLEKVQEGSSFSLHGNNYITGKPETLIYKDRIYGYRSPVDVRCC